MSWDLKNKLEFNRKKREMGWRKWQGHKTLGGEWLLWAAC